MCHYDQPRATTTHTLMSPTQVEVDSVDDEPTKATRLPRRTYSNWPKRVVGTLIDWVVPAILIFIGVKLLYGLATSDYREITSADYTIQVTEVHLPWALFYLFLALALVFWLLNKGYLEGKSGKSLGKRLMKDTTVHRETLKPLGITRGTVRAVITYVELAFVGLTSGFLIAYQLLPTVPTMGAFVLGFLLFPIAALSLLWPVWARRRDTLFSDKITKAVVYKDSTLPTSESVSA